MVPVIFKVQVIPDCNADCPKDGVFRMGWFTITGNDPKVPPPDNYVFIRSRLARILCLPENQEFDVCFQDTDGKRKLITKDEELRRAVSILEDGLCNVYVCLKGPAMACG